MVTASDGNSNTDDATIDVTIAVMDVNEAPTFPYNPPLNRLYVYKTGGTVYDPEGELIATDPDDPDGDGTPSIGAPLEYTPSGLDGTFFSYKYQCVGDHG